MTHRDLTITKGEDGRITVDPGEGDQEFTDELLENADPGWLAVIDDLIVLNGDNGTFVYRVVHHNDYPHRTTVGRRLVDAPTT